MYTFRSMNSLACMWRRPSEPLPHSPSAHVGCNSADEWKLRHPACQERGIVRLDIARIGGCEADVRRHLGIEACRLAPRHMRRNGWLIPGPDLCAPVACLFLSATALPARSACAQPGACSSGANRIEFATARTVSAYRERPGSPRHPALRCRERPAEPVGKSRVEEAPHGRVPQDGVGKGRESTGQGARSRAQGTVIGSARQIIANEFAPSADATRCTPTLQQPLYRRRLRKPVGASQRWKCEFSSVGQYLTETPN